MTNELYKDVMGAILDVAGVKHFTATEICPVGRSTIDGKTLRVVVLEAPPSRLFKNILPTLEVAEWLREKVGPLIVNSGYRDPRYNAAVGSSPGSMHVQFNALDLRSKTVFPDQLAEILETHPQANQFGLGVYGPKQGNFIHLDTRGYLGVEAVPARWPLPMGLKKAA